MWFVRSFIYLLCYLIIKQESTEENWTTHACGGTEQRTGWWKCCSCHGNDGRWSFRKWDQFVLLLKITWQDGAPPPLPLPPIQPCLAAAPVSYYKMAAQSPPPTRKPWTLVVRCYLFVSTHVATGFAARRLSSAEFTSWIWQLRCERKIFAAELHFDANVFCQGLFNGFFSVYTACVQGFLSMFT